jgi:hypothetical protein
VHRIVLATAIVLLVACKKDDPSAPPCSAVGANFVTIVHASTQKTKLSEAEQRGLDAQLPAMRDSLVEQCSEGGWSADVRRCLAQANDNLAFEACEQHLSDAQRQRLAAKTK